MLIGLNGFKSAGKDTVGDHLVEEYGFIKMSFAALLKQSASALFDIPVEKWDEWKNNPNAVVNIHVWAEDMKSEESYSQTVRTFLQRYGTESHRDVFGYDFWVEQAFKGADLFKNVVFTDARFNNELETIRNRYGFNIQVIRDETDVQSGGHASEVRPDPSLIDFIVDNNGTKDELYTQVENFMEGSLYGRY